ncbi:GntR family transcriptional regulator [Enterovirga aerilata]|uniref:GntR family transcriptional regulator n=1 Tax=Enterovirga aerilata TaxID=2730920 RepID=A0A849I1L1_9HYPH|nr:GntR family transcriptional regulator [Enterovirga sp. DB1703]NNM71484.1 GntR family transcriptional regulator [Enterovirga sp. DB1703]
MAEREHHGGSGGRTAPGPPKTGLATTHGTVAKLHDQAFAILASRIRAGTIPHGARLLESRVAADFGISRAPARQALAALAEAGLVERASGRGYLAIGRGESGTGAAPAPEPVQLSSAAGWERIYAEVETSIVSRTAFASWRVIEAEIAKHYGVSRTIARDVVARLNQRGVIRKDERARWYAPGLTHDHVAELYEMRWTLEPVALLKAADAAPPELVRRLRANIEAAISEAETLGGAELDALEAELHVELLGFCGQRTLMEALRSYQSLLVAHSFLYRWLPPLYPSEPFLPEHLAVLEALDENRRKAAAAALREHLQASLARALTRIDAVAADIRPEPLPYLSVLP